MKKNFLLYITVFIPLLSLLLPAGAFSSVITFSAVNDITLEKVQLDSISILNITRDLDTMLVGSDVFDLSVYTGAAPRPSSLPAEFSLSSNYPNSFENQTRFQVDLPLEGELHIVLYNILGERVAEDTRHLSAGSHIFTLNGGALAAGVYFIKSEWRDLTDVTKIVKTGGVSGLNTYFSHSGSAGVSGKLSKFPIIIDEKYRFIGFADGFVSDTLDNQVPLGGENYRFAMMPIPPPDDFTSHWRGFNLLGKFTVEWNNSGYEEEDFAMISDLGFNFVRLPIDYRTYTKNDDWGVFIEEGLADIDNAVEWGQIYDIHVCINLHRAPGYCVNPPSNPLPPSQDVSLWNSKAAQEIFTLHWKMFAERYRDVPTEMLSFNLVNEPANVDGTTYVNAVKGAIEAIRTVSPDRIIVSDAVDWGNARVDDILAYDVVMSPHFYNPMQITHYRAEWVSGSDTWELPQWPITLMPSYFYGAWKTPWNTPLILTGRFTAGTEVTIHVNQVSTRADFSISANGVTVFSKNFTPGPGEGEWKEVIYREEWNCYQNIYDREYRTTLPRDAEQIIFQVHEGDWMTFTEVKITPPQATGAPSLRVIPGIGDWGVPQASYEISAEGELIIVEAPAGFEDHFIQNGFLTQWVDLKNQGVPVFVGEWGVYRYTPHETTLRFMADRLKAMKSAGLGWALWNFRGSFGIMDSDRSDVNYEIFNGHKLDRKMLDLLLQYR
jgi:aryl-phospho-beta-D-glucosidase BglC (GH1 family)